MIRYQTRWHVTTDKAEAERLAKIDKITAEIKVTDNVDLIHSSGSWALWSDGEITTAIGLDKSLKPKGLPKDVAKLIGSVWMSDSPRPMGGWSVLTTIKEIISTETLSIGRGTGYFASPKTERITVRRINGSTDSIYVYTVGYCEGYVCDVFPSRKEMEKCLRVRV